MVLITSKRVLAAQLYYLHIIDLETCYCVYFNILGVVWSPELFAYSDTALDGDPVILSGIYCLSVCESATVDFYSGGVLFPDPVVRRINTGPKGKEPS